MTSSPAASSFARLAELGSATVHEALGQIGAMDSAIKPVASAMRLAGPARTVRCPPDDNLTIHYAVATARPGEVLVVDCDGHVESGPWGDLLTLYAQQVGVAGLVIDGSVRDTQGIDELHFPVFSRGVCIKGTSKDRVGELDKAIVCGGVTVRPGDIVVADADGVVVVPADHLDRAVDLTEQRAQHEEQLRAQIRAGARLADLIGATERLGVLGLPLPEAAP